MKESYYSLVCFPILHKLFKDLVNNFLNYKFNQKWEGTKVIKKKMSVLLAAVLVASGVGMAKPALAATAPKVIYAQPSITMAEVEDDFSFALQSDVAENVQYQVWAQNIATGKWFELTKGYSEAVKGNEPFIPAAVNHLPAGAYKASIWVKAEGSKAKYDNYLTTNFKIQKDGYFASRAKMDNLGLKNTYSVDEFVAIQGNDEYKLHIYNPAIENRKEAWTIDANYNTAAETSKEVKFTAPGKYLVDVWGKKADSTNRYDGWVLKVVTVEEQKGIAVETSVKAATVGSSVTVKSAYPGAASYQIFDGEKQVTGVAKLGEATTMYPANKEGQKYTVKLLNAQGTVLKSASVVLGETAMVEAPVVKEVKVDATFKPATVGSSVTVTADLEGAVKFQVFRGDKQITGAAELGKATTAYPAAKDGEEVTVKLLDAQDNVLQVVEKVKLVQAK